MDGHCSETLYNSPLPAAVRRRHYCTKGHDDSIDFVQASAAAEAEATACCGGKLVDCLCIVLPLLAVSTTTAPLEWSMEVEDGATSSSLSLVSESHVHTPPQLDMAAGGGAWPYAPGTSRASIPSASTSSARSARSAHDTDEQLAASGGGTSAQSATEVSAPATNKRAVPLVPTACTAADAHTHARPVSPGPRPRRNCWRAARVTRQRRQVRLAIAPSNR